MQANRTRSRSLLSPFLHPGEGGERTEGQARPASDQRHGGERSRDFGSRGPRSPLLYVSRWERVTSTRVTPSLWGSVSSRDGARGRSPRRGAEASTRRRRRPRASSARGGGHSGGGRSLCSLRPAALSALAERPGAHGPWRSSPVARQARVTSDCEQAARRGGRLSARVDAGRGRAFSPPRPGKPRALPGGGRHARVVPSAPALPPQGWPAGPEARAAPEKSSFH